MSVSRINEVLKDVDCSAALFKKAVSWTFHSETDESIRDELGYEGNFTDVFNVYVVLRENNFSCDEVYEWSKS